MRICFVGNTNNAPYRLVRAMRRIGFDASLVVYESPLLHRPEGEDASLRDAYPAWMHDFSHLGEADLISPSTRLGELLSLLERADALVLNGLGPSLRTFVDRPSVAWLTGSDLDYYATFSTLAAREGNWSAEFRNTAAARLERSLWTGLIARQREGILRSVATSYFHPGIAPVGDALLEGIGIAPQSRFFIYAIIGTDETYNPPEPNPVPRLLCGARLTWKPPIPPGGSLLDFKGSDVMIRGVARYLGRNPDVRFELRLPRKGLHVRETEDLVRECGLEQYVVWLDEMPLQQFLDEVRRADVVFDQLGESMMGMVGVDALALGRPVITNARPALWKRATGEVLPVCQAETHEQVCEWLERLLSDPKARIRVGREAARYARNRLSAEANAKDIVTRLERARKPTEVQAWTSRNGRG